MDYEPIPIISNDFPKVVIPLLDSAMHAIDIIVFDWRFYKHDPACSVSQFNMAIARAVQRGITVRCLVQSAAVVNQLKLIGVKARMIHTKRILHTKLLMVDGKKVIIGSHNYTQNAFTNNHEASLFVVLANAVNGLTEYFNNLYGL